MIHVKKKKKLWTGEYTQVNAVPLNSSILYMNGTAKKPLQKNSMNRGAWQFTKSWTYGYKELDTTEATYHTRKKDCMVRTDSRIYTKLMLHWEGLSYILLMSMAILNGLKFFRHLKFYTK